MLVILREKTLCVCEIQGILDKPQPQISKQLKVLKAQNLVKSFKQDKFIYYMLIEHQLLNQFLDVIFLNSEMHVQLSKDIKSCQTSHIFKEEKC